MDLKEQLIQKAAKIIQGRCNEDGYCALTLMDRAEVSRSHRIWLQ